MKRVANLILFGIMLGLAIAIPLAVYLALDAILYALKVALLFIVVVGLLILAYIGYMRWQRERHQQYRVIDGSFPLQRHKLPTGEVIMVDINKVPGAAYAVGAGFGYQEIASSVGPQVQLLIDQAVQQTRSLAAISPGDDAQVRTHGMINQPRINAGAISKLLPKPARPEPDLPALPAPIAPPVARINATTALAQSTGSRWILGQADSGDLAVFNPTAHAHAAIVGATGTGKTTSVGFGLALAALRSGWHVTILDPDGGANWQPFSSHAEWHDTDRSNFPDQIAAIHHHYEKRANLANPRPCLVVIEEYGDLIRQLRTASRSDADAVDAMLDSLLQRGRKRCIHLALIDQYPQHWSPAVVGGTKFRAVFQLGPNQGAKMEEYKAASLPDVGRFLVRGTEYNSWAMDAQLPALLRQLPAPDKPRRIINGTATVIPQPQPDRSAGLSVTPSATPSATPSVGLSVGVPQEVDPTPPAPPKAPSERSEETRLAIIAYLDAHPKATQADVRRDLKTSLGYTHECWHAWHKAQSTVQPINQRPTTVPPTVVPDAIHGWREIVEADNPASLEQMEAIRQAIASGKITVG